MARADEPAFPTECRDDEGQLMRRQGLTIREWLAGQALVGLLAFPHPEADGQFEPENAAQEAFAMADAMLRESEKK